MNILILISKFSISYEDKYFQSLNYAHLYKGFQQEVGDWIVKYNISAMAADALIRILNTRGTVV